MNISAERKEVEEESSTFGDSDHPIVIGDSPEKKSVRYEGCGPRILKDRIGAKIMFNETPKLQIPKSKRLHKAMGLLTPQHPQTTVHWKI